MDVDGVAATVIRETPATRRSVASVPVLYTTRRVEVAVGEAM